MTSGVSLLRAYRRSYTMITSLLMYTDLLN